MPDSRIAELFTLENTVECYLKIEAALARAQAELGLIPIEAANHIRRNATIRNLDLERLAKDTDRTGYAVAPLVRQLANACGESGRFVHWGATTQDVVNTALALQLNETFSVVHGEVCRLLRALIDLAERHRHTVMAARTFGGHALPITFGFKVAVWLSSMLRHVERFIALTKAPLEGEFAGVAGTLASLGTQGLAVRKRLMEILSLPEPLITWGSMRDQIFERLAALVGVTNSLSKIADDIAELSSTEIRELAEPNAGGKDTSSTLPFKANPIICAQISAAAALVAQSMVTVLCAGRQRQERSGEGLLEIQALGPACVETGKCLSKSLLLLEGLEVYPDRMRMNLGLTNGIILAERFMMELAPSLGRLRAHDLVHEACQRAIKDEMELKTALSQIPEVSSRLSPDILDSIADPQGYLGCADKLITTVIERARTYAG